MHLGQFNFTTGVSIHEISTSTGTIQYLHTEKSDDTGLCTVVQTETLSLPSHIFSINGNFIFNKYRIYLETITDFVQVHAHYGKIRAGGVNLNSLSAVSDKPGYSYMADMYVLDVPATTVSRTVFAQKLSVTENLSFDIASYSSNRRISLTNELVNNRFPKIQSIITLSGRTITIDCKDTIGNKASEHISNALGISDANIIASCDLVINGFNHAVENVLKQSIKLANIDSSDDAMLYVLPEISEDVESMQILSTYNIDIATIGLSMTFGGSLILTDTQIAELRPMTLSSLYNTVDIAFTVYDDYNDPIANASIVLAGQTKVTDGDGFVSFNIARGDYLAILSAATYTGYQQHVVADISKSYEIVMQKSNLRIWSFGSALPSVSIQDLPIIIEQGTGAFSVNRAEAIISNATVDFDSYVYIVYEGQANALRGITQNNALPVLTAFDFLYTAMLTVGGMSTLCSVYKSHDPGAFTNATLKLEF